MIEEVKLPTTLFTFSEEDGTPITDADEIENIRKQMELKEGNYYDAKTVNEAIDAYLECDTMRKYITLIPIQGMLLR